MVTETVLASLGRSSPAYHEPSPSVPLHRRSAGLHSAGHDRKTHRLNEVPAVISREQRAHSRPFHRTHVKNNDKGMNK